MVVVMVDAAMGVAVVVIVVASTCVVSTGNSDVGIAAAVVTAVPDNVVGKAGAVVTVVISAKDTVVSTAPLPASVITGAVPVVDVVLVVV